MKRRDNERFWGGAVGERPLPLFADRIQGIMGFVSDAHKKTAHFCAEKIESVIV